MLACAQQTARGDDASAAVVERVRDPSLSCIVVCVVGFIMVTFFGVLMAIASIPKWGGYSPRAFLTAGVASGGVAVLGGVMVVVHEWRAAEADARDAERAAEVRVGVPPANLADAEVPVEGGEEEYVVEGYQNVKRGVSSSEGTVRLHQSASGSSLASMASDTSVEAAEALYFGGTEPPPLYLGPPAVPGFSLWPIRPARVA
jgi:hypothetical protein